MVHGSIRIFQVRHLLQDDSKDTHDDSSLVLLFEKGEFFEEESLLTTFL
jgi:hypothetical protein